MALILAVDEDCRACALTDDERMEVSGAACLAMLKHWPGIEVENRYFMFQGAYSRIILPLPQENTNGEG